MSDTKSQNPAIDVSGLRIAHVYAEALLNAATKLGQLDDVLAELDSLVHDVFPGSPLLEALFSGAALGRNVRRDAINKAFSGRSSEAFLAFLHALNDHERLDLIRTVRLAAHEIDDERRGRLRVLVQSAVSLPDSVRGSLVDQIRSVFQMEPLLDARIQPELLGGLKIRIRDIQVDATVRSHLDNLKKQILARSSYEIQSRRDRFSSANGN